MKSICVCIQKIMQWSFCVEFPKSQPAKIFNVFTTQSVRGRGSPSPESFRTARCVESIVIYFSGQGLLRSAGLPLCFVVSIGPCCKSREGNEKWENGSGGYVLPFFYFQMAKETQMMIFCLWLLNWCWWYWYYSSDHEWHLCHSS